MSKLKLGISLGVIIVLAFLTNCHEFSNPVDAESDNYLGFESFDFDNDGVPSYQDVDDIYPIYPENGWIFTQLPVALVTNEVDSSRIIKFIIQVTTDENFCVYKEFCFKTNTFHVIPVNPHNAQNYYWR